jgi:hypothetical protein
MSILTDAVDAFWAHQKAAGAQRRIEWTPEASREENHRHGQRAQILARLKMGPATTLEMMNMGGSGFSSRIAELRKEGWDIKAKRIDRHAMYELVQGKP